VKSTTLLLAASLLANIALVAVIATHSAAPAPASVVVASPAARTATAKNSDALRAALNSGDAAALEAAGLSPELARELALGRIFSRLAERARAQQAKSSDGRWWSNRGNAAGSREQQAALRRELANALNAAFGTDLGLGGPDAGQLAYLAPEKRDGLRRILQDYDEMMSKFSTNGLQLASDKERLRLLKAERDRDIASLLSPDELLAYEMQTSSTGNSLRNRYGDAIESEDDFRKLYALQKAFDEKYPLDSLTGRITPETLRERSDAQRQLQDDMRAALGDDKYAALRRATDGDLRNVDSLVSRLNLPANTTDQIAAARESFAAESQRISADTSLNGSQRRAQLQDLAARAKTDVVRTLGNEAGEAYAQSSPWLNMLQSGMAYSTTPQANAPGGLITRDGAGPSVYPVLPAGATVGGVSRTVVSGVGSSEGGNVMTFTTSVGSDSGGNQPAAGRQIIVAPPTSDPPKPKQ
jgi:hypothetical protein